MAAVWRMKLEMSNSWKHAPATMTMCFFLQMSDTIPISEFPRVIVSNHAEKNGRIVFINPSLKL